MDALTLALALRLDGRRIRPGRVALGALLGAAAAAAVRALGLPRAGQAALLPLIAAAMARAAGFRGRSLPAGTLLVTSAAGLLGGLTLALGGALGSLDAAYALAAACALATAARAARRSAPPGARARIVVRYRGRQAVFAAMSDSGNSLRDYLTRRPVIVLPEKTGRARLALGEAALRPIPAQTAGGRQLMWCFVPDETLVWTAHGRRRVRAAVALAPGLPRGTPALLPGELIGRE